MRRFYRKVPKKSNKQNEVPKQNANQTENQIPSCPTCGVVSSQSLQNQLQENQQQSSLGSNAQHIQNVVSGNQQDSQSNDQPIQNQQSTQNQPLVPYSQTNNQHVQLQPNNSQGNQNQQSGQLNQNEQGTQNDQSNQINSTIQNAQAENNPSNQNNQQNQTNGMNQSNQNAPSQPQNQNASQNAQNNNQNTSVENSVPIYKKVKDNIDYIKKILGNPQDLIVRELSLEISQQQENSQQEKSDSQNAQPLKADNQTIDENQATSEIQCSILYISGLCNAKIVNDNILKMLQEKAKPFNGDLLEQINQEIIAITDTKKINTFQQVIDTLLSGNSILFIEGEMTALEMGTAGAEKRSLEESQAETIIRGSRLAFIEDIDTNITLIRRELKDPNLRIEIQEIGRRSKQKVALCYVEGIINPDILNEVKRRLNTIDIDFLPDSGVVEQWIEDSSLSPFPQVIETERPDRVAYTLLLGKVAILVDGSPFALTTPITLGDAFLTTEDFSQRWIVASSMRMLRFLSVLIALFLPGLYVALTSYHPGMLPTQLILAITAAREGVPFPSIIEVLLMAVTFEILQEAGIRLPKPIGQTVGIVGGVVIGDVAVSAGIVGPALVIITSLTAMSSFTLPNYSMSISLRIYDLSLSLQRHF